MWRSRLRIRYCYSCGTGHNCCAGSIPCPGTSICFEYSNKKKGWGGLNKGLAVEDYLKDTTFLMSPIKVPGTLYFVVLDGFLFCWWWGFFGGRASLCY